MNEHFVQGCVKLATARYLAAPFQPDFTIGRKDNPQVLRWYGIPRNPVFNIYYHVFLRSDADFALHNHPWAWNMTIVLRNRYLELIPNPTLVSIYGMEAAASRWEPMMKARLEGDRVVRWGRSPHRIEMFNEGEECHTVFLTGPKLPVSLFGQWGFYCPKGFVPFRKIVKYETGIGSEPMDGCPE